jgi:hypothetical protein
MTTETEIHVVAWPVEDDFQDSYADDLTNSLETWAPEFAASAYREQCRFVLADALRFTLSRCADSPRVVPVAMTYQWERRPAEDVQRCPHGYIIDEPRECPDIAS